MCVTVQSLGGPVGTVAPPAGRSLSPDCQHRGTLLTPPLGGSTTTTTGYMLLRLCAAFNDLLPDSFLSSESRKWRHMRK